jgi:hypothetical protein
VQIRQDFSKNLIDVLQTGSSNLTLADTNEEAANSQALSTRQACRPPVGAGDVSKRPRAVTPAPYPERKRPCPCESN